MIMFWIVAVVIAIVFGAQYDKMPPEGSVQLIILDVFEGVMAIWMSLVVVTIYRNRKK